MNLYIYTENDCTSHSILLRAISLGREPYKAPSVLALCGCSAYDACCAN